MSDYGIMPGQYELKRPLNSNISSYSHFALMLMTILDPGQQILTTPVFKVVISFIETQENLGMNINPGCQEIFWVV